MLHIRIFVIELDLTRLLLCQKVEAPQPQCGIHINNRMNNITKLMVRLFPTKKSYMVHPNFILCI